MVFLNYIPILFYTVLLIFLSFVQQDTAGSSSYSQSVPRSTNAGYGEQTMRSSAAVHVGGGSSFESYRRQHEITVIVCV